MSAAVFEKSIVTMDDDLIMIYESYYLNAAANEYTGITYPVYENAPRPPPLNLSGENNDEEAFSIRLFQEVLLCKCIYIYIYNHIMILL